MKNYILDYYADSSNSLHDPLYDMEVSDEQLFYYKVVAAFSMVFRSKRPIARVFKLYNLTQQDLTRFVELFPEAAKKMVEAAFIAAFFMPGSQHKPVHPLFFVVIGGLHNLR